jgi:hypothetical protein
LYISSSLDQEGAQTFFSQFFGCPAAGDTGAYYYRVKLLHVFLIRGSN